MKYKKTFIALTVLVFMAVVIAATTTLLLLLMPNQEAIRNWVGQYGSLGFFAVFFLAYISTVVTPLNFGAIGFAGGFLYGVAGGLPLLWAARTLGNFTNFFLTKKFGRRILSFFFSERFVSNYDRLLNSEKSAISYFILCFLPFFPSDYASYFLGCSKLKKHTFILITLVGNVGSAFSLAYIGSGAGLKNPYFLASLSLLLVSGLYWIHSEKKKLALQ